jgi:cation diffusion facilitator family transporter
MLLAARQSSSYAESQRGAWLSIGAYLGLTALKLGVGLWTGSTALYADGLNNSTDILASVAVLLGLRIAGRPADEDHRYGHAKAETIASVVAGLIMGGIGLLAGWESLQRLWQGSHVTPSLEAAGVGLVAAGMMWAVYRYNKNLAERTGAKALMAAAYDNRSDALTSLGTVAAVVAGRLGWGWADPLIGLFIAGIILRTAWAVGSEAAHALMDGFAPEELAAIHERAAAVPGVRRVLALRARHIGNEVAVEMTIGVAPSLTIVEAHEVSHLVEEALLGWSGIEHVHVHMEPWTKKK